jgi:hypothetical protein
MGSSRFYSVITLLRVELIVSARYDVLLTGATEKACLEIRQRRSGNALVFS